MLVAGIGVSVIVRGKFRLLVGRGIAMIRRGAGFVLRFAGFGRTAGGRGRVGREYDGFVVWVFRGGRCG